MSTRGSAHKGSANNPRQGKTAKTAATKTVAGKSVTVATPLDPKSALAEATQSSETQSSETQSSETQSSETQSSELDRAQAAQAETPNHTDQNHADQNHIDQNHAGQTEEIMATQEKIAEGQPEAKQVEKSESSLAIKEKGAIKPSTFSYLGDRYVSPGDIEIAESFISAGLRPVAVSHLEIFGTILNGRPIEASSLQVMDYAIPGQRPVFNSGVVVKDDLTLPGGRPITASSPALMNAELLIGGRPIASNDIIDPEPAALMGYLD